MDTCVCMAESVHCSPEITTILLISYIQYKMLLVLKKDKNFKKILRFLKWSTSKKKKKKNYPSCGDDTEVVRENALVWFSYQVVWQTEDSTC